MKDLKGLAIGAKDGDIGEVNDFVFDDKNWTVRYLVADTSRWLPGRKVLISPIIVDQADWEGKRLPVLLTKEQVKNSPDINMDENLLLGRRRDLGAGHGTAGHDHCEH
jgi:hypothetical protein